MVINLNLTHKDPELRELFNKKDFRVALSHGMDRQGIIDTALLGEGEPWQQGPFEDAPQLPQADRDAVSSSTTSDEANALLDSIGLDKRGPDGTRLLPSGRPAEVQDRRDPDPPARAGRHAAADRAQWAKIGIDMDVNATGRTFFYERTSNGNDHDAAVWGGQASWVPGEIPQQIVPVHHDSRWGIPWSQWYNTGGKSRRGAARLRSRSACASMTRPAATVDPEKRRRARQQDRRHRSRRVRGDVGHEGAADLRHQEDQPQERAGVDAELLVLPDSRRRPCRRPGTGQAERDGMNRGAM